MTGYYLAAVPVAALIVTLAWRHAWRKREGSLQIEAWLESFSPDTYRPMLRLANSGDTGYLKIHRGPEAAASYRRRQRRMLREYLHGLSRDFHRLHTIAAESACRSRIDRENSALVLIEEKLEFIFSVWIIELRLVLDKFSPCTINPRPLLANVDELTARNCTQSPAAAWNFVCHRRQSQRFETIFSHPYADVTTVNSIDRHQRRARRVSISNRSWLGASQPGPREFVL